MKEKIQYRYDAEAFESEMPGKLIPFLRGGVTPTQQSRWTTWLSWIYASNLRLVLVVGSVDILAVVVSVWAALSLKARLLGPEDFQAYIGPTICYVLYLCLMLYLWGGYTHFKDKRPEQELEIIIKANAVALILVLCTNFLLNKGVLYSRIVFITTFTLSSILLIAERFLFKSCLSFLWSRGHAKQNIIVVGNSEKYVRWLLDHLHIQRYTGFNILGYLAAAPFSKTIKGLHYLGPFEQIDRILRLVTVDKVFFAMSHDAGSRQTLIERLEKCSQLKIPALIVSEIFNDFHFSLTLDGYTGIFQVVRPTPGYAKPLYRFSKRMLDIVGSIALILISLPLYVIIGLAIKWHDGGPIFFRHRLVGKDGKLFDMLKFRTMVVNAQEILEKNPQLLEEFKKNYKLKDDPRVTPVGKWLRKSSLDELPQFFNILRGDMSIVGPRPVKLDELEKFGDFKHERIKVRPGLTGFWQVSGRCNTDYEERIQMDRFYLNKCNIWLDLYILLKTPSKVLKFDGAM